MKEISTNESESQSSWLRGSPLPSEIRVTAPRRANHTRNGKLNHARRQEALLESIFAAEIDS